MALIAIPIPPARLAEMVLKSEREPIGRDGITSRQSLLQKIRLNQTRVQLGSCGPMISLGQLDKALTRKARAIMGTLQRWRQILDDLKDMAITGQVDPKKVSAFKAAIMPQVEKRVDFLMKFPAAQEEIRRISWAMTDGSLGFLQIPLAAWIIGMIVAAGASVITVAGILHEDETEVIEARRQLLLAAQQSGLTNREILDVAAVEKQREDQSFLGKWIEEIISSLPMLIFTSLASYAAWKFGGAFIQKTARKIKEVRNGRMIEGEVIRRANG